MSATAPSIDRRLRELARPVGRESREVVACVRGYLEEVRAHLERLHRESGSGSRVNEANSDLTDRLDGGHQWTGRELVQPGTADLGGKTGEVVKTMPNAIVRGVQGRQDLILPLAYRGAQCCLGRGRFKIGVGPQGVIALQGHNDAGALATGELVVNRRAVYQ